MKKIFILFSVFALCFLTSCEQFKQYFSSEQPEDAIASANGQYLYAEDIAAILGNASTAEDSARLQQQYIEKWTTDIILYDKAQRQLGNNAEIEKLVEDYRRSLYVNAYEQQWLQKNMPVTFNIDTLKAVYENNTSLFLLEEELWKGILLILPKGAPDKNRLEGWLANPTAANIEKIEKYAYAYASGYQLFMDNWVPQSQIEKYSNPADENYEGVLSIQKRMRVGEPMPFEFAQPKIEQWLLRQRENEYIEKLREKIYREQ